jgi:hypothetical protein
VFDEAFREHVGVMTGAFKVVTGEDANETQPTTSLPHAYPVNQPVVELYVIPPVPAKLGEVYKVPERLIHPSHPSVSVVVAVIALTQPVTAPVDRSACAFAATVPAPIGNPERPPNCTQPTLSDQAKPVSVPSLLSVTAYEGEELALISNQPTVSDQEYPRRSFVVATTTATPTVSKRAVPASAVPTREYRFFI